MAKQLVYDAVEALRSLSPPTSPKTPSPQQKRSSSKFFMRTLSQKRTSKMMAPFARSSKDLTNVVAFTDEMIRLETVIMSTKGRQLLIQDLLSVPGDHSVKIRFICAIDTWDAAENKDDRQRLAQKIVETFVIKGGMFTIASLPEERIEALTDGNYDHLVQARRDVLEQLTQNEAVMEVVGVVETIDGV